MLKVTGWTGAPGATGPLETARAFLTAAAGCPSSSAAGPGWVCFGPEVEAAGGIGVSIRGQPIWRTSDTRILSAPSGAHAVLAAYRIHGPKFLELLHGRFAVAVLDSTTRTTLLAVDRMGIERLVYAQDQDALWFGSSAESLARRPGTTPRLRRQALLSYLFFHMIPSPETAFEGVRKVPPASVVIWRDGELTERSYWQPAFVSSGGETQQALGEALHAALDTAVRFAQPDAETGAFLSGGLDSSTVAGVLAKVTAPRKAKTFSIGFGFEDYDELRFSRIANRHFGCEPHEYVVDPEDIVGLFPLIARAYDEPFGNASALPTYCCARLAHEHGMSHLLAGDGGDEIFAGNKRYAEQRLFERYKLIPAILRKGMVEPMLRVVPEALGGAIVRKGRSYVAQANVPLPDRLESWNFLHRLGFEQVLDPEFISAIDRNGPVGHMRSVYASGPAAALVDKMLHYDWRFTLADNDLRKVGTMCELAGVRVSYPMLHPDVVDVAIRVPADLKMRGTHLRTFYKQAMMDFLPHEIINKTKHGFGLPFGLWLERSPQLAQLIDANLASLGTRRVINPKFIEQLRQLHGQDDARYYGGFVWTLAMLEQWFQEHRLAP